MTDYKNLIDGEMVDNGEWLEVLNPANEQVVGRVPAAGKDELDRAVAEDGPWCIVAEIEETGHGPRPIFNPEENLLIFRRTFVP